ncbi:MAG: aldo/keto reductase [Acidobacteriia bacterium]|nr:aldo/keto reductase [Terriglobia bacterium]
MHYRPLGRTGLAVSALSLGTVSLGVDYGIQAPGEFGRPDEAEAIRLLRAAVDRGITLVDTAPTYGESERLVGRALGRDARMLFATKVGSALHERPGELRGPTLRAELLASIDRSRRAFGRDVIDILQFHNATRELIDAGEVTDILLDVKRRGLVRVLGASVLSAAAAMAAIASGEYEQLQVAFSALDQRMARDVLPAAQAAGVGVVVRSALLKGALTPKAQWLPEALAPLREAAIRARDALAGGVWDRLPDAALRFCLSTPGVATVLTGARTMTELDAALEAEAAGPLDAPTADAAGRLAVADEALLDPWHWPVP